MYKVGFISVNFINAMQVIRVAKSSPGRGSNRLNIRLESLTDMVFGLALSIGALLLAISNSATVADIESNMLSFGFSFLILIFVWIRYTSIISLLPNTLRQKRSVFYLNVLLLFFVAIEPYLFNILHLSTTQDLASFASSMYAIDIGAIILILWILIQLLVHDYRTSHKDHVPTVGHMRIAASSLAMSVMFFVSAAPIFWDTQLMGVPLRFVMWAVLIPLMLIARNSRPRKSQE